MKGESKLLKANFSMPLRHFELQVNITVGNEIAVFVGPSGSGKTTILKCLAGLKTPAQGMIALNDRVLWSNQSETGKPSTRFSLPTRERRVGFVFQEYALFPHMTVLKNVSYGVSKEKMKEKPNSVEQVLNLLGIFHLKDRYPQQISGGEKQRVALARVLVTEPEIMLLDEPLSALDQEIRSELQQELKKLQRQWQIPFILVTHDMDEAELLGDQIIKINQGKITTLKL